MQPNTTMGYSGMLGIIKETTSPDFRLSFFLADDAKQSILARNWSYVYLRPEVPHSFEEKKKTNKLGNNIFKIDEKSLKVTYEPLKVTCESLEVTCASLKMIYKSLIVTYKFRFKKVYDLIFFIGCLNKRKES